MTQEQLQDNINNNLTRLLKNIKPAFWDTIQERFENWNENLQLSGENTIENHNENVGALIVRVNLLQSKNSKYFKEEVLGLNQTMFDNSLNKCLEDIKEFNNTFKGICGVA